MADLKSAIGSKGEDIAMQWLRDRGFYIVERNWRMGHYEIDIVAQRWDTLHIVEVRTHHASSWQTAIESVDHTKMQSLQRAVSLYRATHRTRLLTQIDLIAITVDQNEEYSVEYIENLI